MDFINKKLSGLHDKKQDVLFELMNVKLNLELGSKDCPLQFTNSLVKALDEFKIKSFTALDSETHHAIMIYWNRELLKATNVSEKMTVIYQQALFGEGKLPTIVDMLKRLEHEWMCDDDLVK